MGWFGTGRCHFCFLVGGCHCGISLGSGDSGLSGTAAAASSDVGGLALSTAGASWWFGVLSANAAAASSSDDAGGLALSVVGGYSKHCLQLLLLLPLVLLLPLL